MLRELRNPLRRSSRGFRIARIRASIEGIAFFDGSFRKKGFRIPLVQRDKYPRGKLNESSIPRDYSDSEKERETRKPFSGKLSFKQGTRSLCACMHRVLSVGRARVSVASRVYSMFLLHIYICMTVCACVSLCMYVYVRIVSICMYTRS